MPNSKLAGHAAQHSTWHGKTQLKVKNCECHKQQMATCWGVTLQRIMLQCTYSKTSNYFSESKTFWIAKDFINYKPLQSKRLTLTRIVASCSFKLNITLVLLEEYVAEATLAKRISAISCDAFKRQTTEKSCIY